MAIETNITKGKPLDYKTIVRQEMMLLYQQNKHLWKKS